MTRRFTPQTTLDNLKKEAKRWLKALRAGDAEARARLQHAYPITSAEPVLRDVQHALALEHGLSGWTALKEALPKQAATNASDRDTQTQLVTQFLEYACPDHHVRGRPAHAMARNAGLRILGQHPEIAHGSIYTAVVCGELEAVERILRENPDAARQKNSTTAPDRTGAGKTGDLFKDIGPKGWEPLLYLCFTRLPHAKSNENAVDMARLLLDHGADPNIYFLAGDSRYSPLVGVIGEGEEDRPAHPERDALARLLLERGAEPYDLQVVYNIHFRGKVLWYLKLIYEFAARAGRQSDWDDPEWHMLDMGGYGSGARWHLEIAVKNNDSELAEWCLAHGANPNAEPAADQRLPQRSLYEYAVLLGNTEIAELLARNGAQRATVVLEAEDAFVAACLRLDRAEVARLLQAHPEYLRSTRAIFAAAKQDRADVVEFVLQLGVPVEIEDAKKLRPLHVAAAHDALRVAGLLVERGAAIDPIEGNWYNTPLGFAVYHDHPRMIELLSPHSRDVWNLAFTGQVERLREVLSAEPQLAMVTGESTPLFWLPDDEAKAVEIIELFLARGADPGFRRTDGMSAADVAKKRGLDEAAAKLTAAATSTTVSNLESLARDLALAYESGDPAALERLNKHYARSFTWEDLKAEVSRRVYDVRQAKGRKGAFDIAQARLFMAREAGFNNWEAFMQAVAKGAPAPGRPYVIRPKQNKIAPRRNLTASEWDVLIAVMKERRIPALDANGMMTDTVLERIAQLDHVTSLNLGGSQQLTDDGLKHLARMPQLQHLQFNEYPGGKLTDRGLEVLRDLPELRTFEMTWQARISDAGVANLRYCEHLESVDLMGTPTGDGALQALAGKPNLRRFKSGRLVTDAGIPMLQRFPMFKQWHGGEPEYSLMKTEREPTHLLLDGPFTNDGVASLAGLDGVSALDFFWHASAMTSDGLKVLTELPNLSALRCDGQLCDDLAMRHIGALPRLRMLVAHGTVATDSGFEALSHSKTIEYVWGRECPNLTGRGFAALSAMPSLRGLGVSCKRVDDDALARLPQFPSLTELMPMDVQDNGFRHVGRCQQLERIWFMYCRDTTDVATEHIGGLRKLKTYYAGKTHITDRSLEILGGMPSLEGLEFYETKGITDPGLVFLAALPRLREIALHGLPNITLTGTTIFPAHVQVDYSP